VIACISRFWRLIVPVFLERIQNVVIGRWKTHMSPHGLLDLSEASCCWWDVGGLRYGVVCMRGWVWGVLVITTGVISGMLLSWVGIRLLSGSWGGAVKGGGCCRVLLGAVVGAIKSHSVH